MRAPRYLVERWQAQLEELFDEPDGQDVLEWLIANHDRKRVVLAGSGFSRNAKNPRGVPIPLWEHISAALAADLRVEAGMFDPLSLADFHRRNLGPSTFQARLLGLLDDAAIEPGAAHVALWRSNPEAVITTNFLDTLLERDASAQAVIEDPDLALSIGPGKAQVIYLHGHRSDFGSWVVGRSDYDDLSDKRPMLFARTRQLFAQFPLLVVGYSLTDPDFHLVYRQMARAMKQRHPMGLAVLLPRHGQDSDQAQTAARKYWEDLGLRIVRFRPPSGDLTSEGDNRWEDRFIGFFDLTKRLEDRKDLEKSYRFAAREEEIAEAFHANVEVVLSAVDDAALGHIWMRSWEGRSRFWIAALNNALPKASHEFARKCAQNFNLEQASQSTSDGTRALPHNRQDGEQVAELRRSDWDPSGSARGDSRFDSVWNLLESQRGREFVWNLNDLLRGGVELPALVRWLRVAIERPDILDEPSVNSMTVLCGFLFVTSWDRSCVKLVQERALPRLSRLAELLGATEAPPGIDPPLVSLLKQARHEVEMANHELARVSYAKAVESAAACSEVDAPLLSYFALRGHADTMVTPNFSYEELERSREANERSRVAREQPFVRQWWARVERFRSALARSRIGRLEQELVRGPYEDRSVSFSNSGGQLDVIRQDAVKRGAPLSVESDLTMSLLGVYDSEYAELEERLRLGLGKTGQWLSRQMTTGDMFRRRSPTLFRDRLQAGAAERTKGVQELSQLLFPPAGTQTVVRRHAIMDVLKSAPRILRLADVPLALAEIVQIRKDDPNVLLGEVFASLSHVCRWENVRDQISVASEGVLSRDFQCTAEKFPWEHWLTCDDFVARGGSEFLEALFAGLEFGFPERLSVGWAFVEALVAAPEDPHLIELCGRFASKVLEDEAGNSSADEQLANLAASSQTFVDRNPEVRARLMLLMSEGDRVVTRILARAFPDSDWGDTARAALAGRVDASQHGQRIEDLVLTMLLDKGSVADWKAFHACLETSWGGLGLLAPVLTRDRWSAEDWKELQALLRIGGHRGKPSSWLLARLDLTVDALGHELARGSLLDDSPDGLGFLRNSIADALGSGDGIVANRAIYSLAQLATYVRLDEEAESIAMALLAAADDVRINVAHGAAFVAHYLIEVQSGAELHGQIATAAQKVARDLQDDPLAIVQRQAVFGAAKGKQVARARGVVR